MRVTRLRAVEGCVRCGATRELLGVPLRLADGGLACPGGHGCATEPTVVLAGVHVRASLLEQPEATPPGRCSTPWCSRAAARGETHCTHHVAMEAARG